MDFDKIIDQFADRNCCCTNQHCKHVRGVCYLDEDDESSFKRRFCGTCRMGFEMQMNLPLYQYKHLNSGRTFNSCLMCGDEASKEWLKMKEKEGETFVYQRTKAGMNSKHEPILKRVDKTPIKVEKNTGVLKGVNLKQPTLEEILFLDTDFKR
ncbi:Hypothetical predicted protein [Paramuricea clavata]|uniref:Uncharacterized protein n=1 Tax=Paramuricea clavata TaxID=317549 RepID=A0A7D9DC85_PARCT|nr:Hypothetical predicted protein [Paramuricea clavata]